MDGDRISICCAPQKETKNCTESTRDALEDNPCKHTMIGCVFEQRCTVDDYITH